MGFVVLLVADSYVIEMNHKGCGIEAESDTYNAAKLTISATCTGKGIDITHGYVACA